MEDATLERDEDFLIRVLQRVKVRVAFLLDIIIASLLPRRRYHHFNKLSLEMQIFLQYHFRREGSFLCPKMNLIQ